MRSFRFDQNSRELINFLFPFNFTIDRTLEIRSKGDSLSKILPECTCEKFSACFEFVRPGMGISMDFDVISEFTEQIFLLKLLKGQKGLILKCQMIYFKENDLMLFCGSPWIVSEHSFKNSGLKISDFAIHDSLIDLLQHLNAQQMAMEDMKRLNSLLKDNYQKQEQLNRDLDHFVYSASHDLRAPALAIEGIVDELEQPGIKEAERQHYFHLIRQIIFRIDDTISDIINYSKNSHLEITNKKCEFTKMVSEVFETLRYLKKHEIKLSIEYEENFDLFTDPNRLKSLIKNLLSNAIKFSVNRPEGSWIIVRGHVNKSQCVVEVEDNGEGIPEGMKLKVFEMFYRASTSSHGSGLGLYICNEIIKKLNGSIGFTSEFGKGSCFTFSISNNAPDE